MSKFKQVLNGVIISYRHKWVIATLSLLVVVCVQEWGAVLQAEAASIIPVNEETYVAPVNHDDEVIEELDAYIKTIEERIFESRQDFYRAMAHADAVEIVAGELIELTAVKPHEDYIKMVEVVDKM